MSKILYKWLKTIQIARKTGLADFTKIKPILDIRKTVKLFKIIVFKEHNLTHIPLFTYL